MIPNEDRLRDLYDEMLLDQRDEVPDREDCEDMGVTYKPFSFIEILNERRKAHGLEPL